MVNLINVSSEMTEKCAEMVETGGCALPSVAFPAPTKAPTKAPTLAPTLAPTKAPTKAPTLAPTFAPTRLPRRLSEPQDPCMDSIRQFC